jgi:hypothetical protein
VRHLWVLGVVAACSSSDDVVGPFSGNTYRFVADRVDVPRDSSEAEAYAADLDGDGTKDNKFGYATAVLAGINDLSTHAPDMLASGALHPIVYIVADSLENDRSVGVFLDMNVPSWAVGGTITDGAFVSNRTRETEHPGYTETALPLFVNADPSPLAIKALEAELVPDGAGGFEATFRGGIEEAEARAVARDSLYQMVTTEPERHLVFQRGVDEDRDGVMSSDELDASILGILVSGDVELFGKTSVSIAFRLHLVPCPETEEPCTVGASTNTCRNRVRDSNETDVDCGGDCQKCFDYKFCSIASDCQSNACNGGTCAEATCSDGVRDGLESDVDCGNACAPCAAGRACAADRDCISNSCNNGAATLGTCS